MSLLTIPREFDSELLARADTGQSTRQLADWLNTRHNLDTSHVTVSRRLSALRLAQQVPPNATTQEIERMIRANEVVLQDADEGLAEVQVLALHTENEFSGDYDLKVAERMATKRASLAVTVHRFLFARLKEAKEQEAMANWMAMARPAPSPQAVTTSEPPPLPSPSLPPTPTAHALPAPSSHAPKALAEPPPAQKVGRNDKCPCGSGMKFKRCCLGSETGCETGSETASAPLRSGPPAA